MAVPPRAAIQGPWEPIKGLRGIAEPYSYAGTSSAVNLVKSHTANEIECVFTVMRLYFLQVVSDDWHCGAVWRGRSCLSSVQVVCVLPAPLCQLSHFMSYPENLFKFMNLEQMVAVTFQVLLPFSFPSLCIPLPGLSSPPLPQVMFECISSL